MNKINPFNQMYYRRKKCIAQSALTNSKRPESHVLGAYPTSVKHSLQATASDCEGNSYIDYICSLGANLLGQGNSRIAKAITRAYMSGAVHSLGGTLEVEVAEMLQGLFPVMERMKFLKTGTEACMAAVKIARAYTGRVKVFSEGYHGWSDIFVTQKPGLGVDRDACKNTITNWTVDDIDEDVACVIVEPVMTVFDDTRKRFLFDLKERCREKNVILIFDEVITGFRFKDLSVYKHTAIRPDLLILGKAMGAGLPLSCVGGRQDLMEKEYFVSSTFAGDNLALAACKELINLLGEVEYNHDTMYRQGELFIEGFNSINKDLIRIEGYGTRGVFVGNEYAKALFFQEAVRAGLLFCPSWFYNYPLQEHNKYTLSICKDIVDRIASNEITLKGQLPQSPFSAKARR